MKISKPWFIFLAWTYSLFFGNKHPPRDPKGQTPRAIAPKCIRAKRTKRSRRNVFESRATPEAPAPCGSGSWVILWWVDFVDLSILVVLWMVAKSPVDRSVHPIFYRVEKPSKVVQDFATIHSI